jgi:hypothetical protein
MPSSNEFQPVICRDKTATVAAGASLSGAVDLEGTQLVGIFVPSNFDGSDITITACDTLAGTYVTVQASIAASTAYTIVTTAGRYVPISPVITAGLKFIKIATTTQQADTDTVFPLATRPV